jgi:hypothetical protein
MEIGDRELWDVRNILRCKLIHVILDRTQACWATGQTTSQQVLAMGSLLDVNVLTIVFCHAFC